MRVASGTSDKDHSRFIFQLCQSVTALQVLLLVLSLQ